MAEERRGFAGYGYETAGGDRVTALRDMIDGGGKGRSGGEFEGGGILSLIANMVASPYGSERERSFGMIPASASPQAPMQSVRPQIRPPGVSPQAPMESVRPQMRPESMVVEALLGGDQAAYDAAFPASAVAELLGGDQAAYDAAFPAPLPPGVVQSLPSLASKMVAQGLPTAGEKMMAETPPANNLVSGSYSEMLEKLHPEIRRRLVSGFLDSGIPMTELLSRGPIPRAGFPGPAR